MATTQQVLEPGVAVMAVDPFAIAEGGTRPYTVRLRLAPLGNVVIRVRVTGDRDVTVDESTLTFTPENWNTAQEVTVSAAQDDDGVDDTATITHSIVAAQTSNEYDSVAIDSLSVSVTDDETPGVTVSETELRIDEGRTDTYVVRLDTQPTGNVRIAVSGGHDSVTVNPTAFTLSRSNWSRGQTITVRSRDDDRALPVSATLTHAIDTDATTADEYDSEAIADVSVTIIDDEAPVDYDLDNNGLLDITTREQMNAVRYDLDGNGLADNEADAAAYRRAFPRMMAGSCGDDFVAGTSVEGDPNTMGTPCIGYELLNDIALSGSWTPIGGNVHHEEFSGVAEYTATFDGNGNTISGLRISLGAQKYVGLFGATFSSSMISNVGLENVNVIRPRRVGRPGGPERRQDNQGLGHRPGVGQRACGRPGGYQPWHCGAELLGGSGGGDEPSGLPGAAVVRRIAGLVGLNRGIVRDTYATGAVRGAGHVGGLVGWNHGGGIVERSYAAGSVTSTQGFPSTGGLVGWQRGSVTNSYWDTETTGRSKGAGQGDAGGAAGRTTAELQKPTSAGDFNSAWGGTYTGVDDNGMEISLLVWNFGSTIQYPCLSDVGDCGKGTQTALQREAPVDYDADGDGLIEVRNQAQLNAIRWDMNGDARPDDASFAGDYAAAFPRIIEGMCARTPDPATSHPGDPGAGCRGYELENDITLSGTFKPLGVDGISFFTSTLEGNGHVIRNLRVSQPAGEFDYNAGLFLFVSGEVRNLGLENVNVSGGNNVGALAGSVSGRVIGVYSTGRVSGRAWVGGLVGELRGSIERSYSTASVSAPLSVGGLVGQIERGGRVSDSYATGTVRATEFRAGGLVGQTDDSASVTNSYSTGRVSGPSTLGGLAGGNVDGGRGTFSGNYWDTQTSGRNVGYGKDDWNGNNQHDHGEPQTGGITGLTTAELQEPRSAAGIYAAWSDTLWSFGRAGDYPCLLGVTPDCVARGIVRVNAADPLEVSEGGSATFTVLLVNEPPTADVVIAMSSDNADVATQPASLTFTPDNWQTAQTVTVSAAQDDDEVDDTATISFAVSGADDYAGIGVRPVNVAATDDDALPTLPTLSVNSPTAQEDGLDTTPMTFVFTLSPASSQTVTAHVEVGAPGQTAMVTDDYDPKSPEDADLRAGRDDPELYGDGGRRLLRRTGRDGVARRRSVDQRGVRQRLRSA